MINAKRVVDIMKRYNMQNLDEFMIAYCTFTRDLESLYLYMHCKEATPEGTYFAQELIMKMADKGILQKEPLNNPHKVEFADLYVTEEFANKFFIEEKFAGEELWNAYPNNTTISGNYVILKKGEKIGNVYYDKDKLIQVYCDKIGHDRQLHNEIIKKVKKAKELGKINFTLRSFILDELWMALDESSQTGDYESKTII